MNHEITIVCESMYHGNTIKIASSMANKLNCNVLNYSEALSTDLTRYKIIGLGSGIFFKSYHPKLIEIASKLNSAQKVFLFSTHGAPFVGQYHARLKNVLVQKGVAIIGEFSCCGYDGTGPFIIFNGGNIGKPNELDQLKAKKFITRILPDYCVNTETVHHGKYVEVRQNQCIHCGSCVKVCPMKVFAMKDKHSEVINAIDCIHCNLCTDLCPSAGIAVQHSWREAIAIAKRHDIKTALYE